MRITFRDIVVPRVSHEKLALPFPHHTRSLRGDWQVRGRRHGGRQDGGQEAKVKFQTFIEHIAFFEFLVYVLKYTSNAINFCGY